MIEVTELMVGDLVHYIGNAYTNGVNIRVREIHEDFVYSTFAADEFYYNELEPILLTPEILEKNGWELHDDVFINKDENISNIIFSISGKFILGGVFIIEYVHQFQQYLRLDGDIEFANNLKV